MKHFLFSVCALALIAGSAYADVPDPSNCSCSLDGPERMLMIPGGGSPWAPNGNGNFTINVRNAANAPINNAVVEILVARQPEYDKTCYDGAPWTVSNTDAAGNVTMNVPGGGCTKNYIDAVVIRANGVDIREYEHVMSPDYAATDNDGISGRWDHLVNPVDLASFVGAYKGGTGPASCHDYDNDGTTNPTDLAVFVSAYYGGTGFCP
jgi:hypothetical protein